MSINVFCTACGIGDHEHHDGEWHGTPGLIGGHQCFCPGGCAPQPNPLLDAFVGAVDRARESRRVAAPAPVPDDERVDICCGHATCQEVVAQHTAAAVDAALTQQREGLAEAIESIVLDATFSSNHFSNGFWRGVADAAWVVREFGEGR